MIICHGVAMKKWKKFLLIWFALGVFGLALNLAGVIDLENKPSQSQKEARDQFLIDWNQLITLKATFISDTLVVYSKNKENPFNDPDDYAREYHPKLVNKQTCKALGLNYIQVRSQSSDTMLSEYTVQINFNRF